MLLFIIFVYSILLFGTIYVGPVSIRVAATCLMAAYLIYVKIMHKSSLSIGKSYILIYIFFSIVMGLSLLANGEFGKYEYLKIFLAHNFVSIVAFFAIDKFILSLKRLKVLIISMILLIFVDDVITIMQYYKDPIGWAIGYVFGDVDKFAGRADNYESLLGMSATPGMCGDVVKNAYLITVLSPLVFCLIEKNKVYTYIFSIMIFVPSFIAVFMTQQRAAFFLLIGAVLLYFLVGLKKNAILIISVSFIVLIIYLLFSGDSVNSYELGRLSDVSINNRSRLIETGIDFILGHPLFGGPVSFMKITGLPTHNIIVDSYINAGILGFIIMTILFMKATGRSFRNIYRSFRKGQNFLMLFSSYALLSCMIYGLSHNTSFLNGEVSAFILLAIMLKVERLLKSPQLPFLLKEVGNN